jgi:hypothetical protein
MDKKPALDVGMSQDQSLDFEDSSTLDDLSGESELLRARLVAAFGDDELLFLDPPSLDTAIVGVAERIGMTPVVVYDRAKLVQAFEAMGMNEEEADEWVSFNVEGAYVGERTPLILLTTNFLFG